jgi:DNA-binding response OmpR family regulator
MDESHELKNWRFICIVYTFGRLKELKMGGNVLLVEDEPLARHSIAAFLERTSYSVHQAENGEVALDLIERVPFDTVIADFQLGGRINGIDVLKRQNDTAPGKRLILITAFGSPDVRSEVTAMGAVYLEKPFLLKDLVSQIQVRF